VRGAADDPRGEHLLAGRRRSRLQLPGVVQNFTSCGTPATFELRIRVRGQIVYDKTGSLSASSGTESPKQPFQL
jgi:hypothetical protein